MSNNLRGRAASPEEITLFAIMGQALLNIQIMEEALSMSITLKADVTPGQTAKKDTDELLKKRRKLTLGNAIKAAVKHKIYEHELQSDLSIFLEERNWLVHKSVEEFYTPLARKKFAERVSKISSKAHRLQTAIEDDLIMFSESHGMDMSRVREEIENNTYSLD